MQQTFTALFFQNLSQDSHRVLFKRLHYIMYTKLKYKLIFKHGNVILQLQAVKKIRNKLRTLAAHPQNLNTPKMRNIAKIPAPYLNTLARFFMTFNIVSFNCLIFRNFVLTEQLKRCIIIERYRGVAQLGRVLGLGPRCRRFESCRLDHFPFWFYFSLLCFDNNCLQFLLTNLTMLSFLSEIHCAGVAQLVEQLICNQQVGGSSPSTSSNPWGDSRVAKGGRL